VKSTKWEIGWGVQLLTARPNNISKDETTADDTSADEIPEDVNNISANEEF